MKPFIYLIFLSLITSIGCSTSSEKIKWSSESLQLPTPTGASLPYLIKGEDGVLYLSWVEQLNDSTHSMYYASWQESDWSQPTRIAQGTNWFVNWADYPMLAINRKGDILAHYLAKTGSGTYAYGVNLVYKKAGQTSWSEPFAPYMDSSETEHGFVTLLPQENNDFVVGWLDGRNTQGHGHEGHGGSMTFRTARFNVITELMEDETSLDERTCDCCQTTGFTTSQGPAFVYRDRSELEIRDMAIVTQSAQVWSEPRVLFADNWRISGCPVNGPRAAAIGDTVGVAWYSSPNNQPQVKVSFSLDGGNTFLNPITIDQSEPVGRVDFEMTPDRGIVSWLDASDSTSTIKIKTVEMNGVTGPEISIAQTSASRASGFPQLEIYESRLFLVWTSVGSNGVMTIEGISTSLME